MILALALLACSDKQEAVDSDTTADTLPAAEADAGPDLEVAVGQVASFDGAASTGVDFFWDFGDGETGAGESAEHTYDAPGNYSAVLQVTGEDGAKRTDSLRVVAYLPAAEAAPDWSRTMVLDAERGRIWAVNPEANTVGVIDLSTQALTELDACETPRTLSLDGDRVAATCERGDALAIFDADAPALLETIDLSVGARPFGVVGRDGTWWVSLQGTSEIAEIDTEGGAAITRHGVGADPRGVAIGADGAVYASRFRSTSEGAPEDAVGRIYTVGGDDITLPFHTGPDSDTTNRGVPNLIQQLVISPDGGWLYAPSLQHNNARGVWRDGETLTFETVVRGAVSMVALSTGEASLSDRKLFDDQDRAIAATFTPRGNYLYVAHPGTGTVQIIDAWTHDIAGSLHSAGAFITDLSLSPDGATLYVHAWLNREVRAFDVSELSGIPAPLWSAATLTDEPLSDEVLLGKRIFHDSADTRMSKDGYLHCASCHPDGRDDGLTWDFTDRGEGLRNTTSLEGRAGTAMGPVHWSGNFDEIQDFENDIRGGFGGTGFLSEDDWAKTSDTLGPAKAGLSAELDALAAYVESLDVTPTSPHPGSEDGEALFYSFYCETCHTPPLYTDSSLDTFLRHDVGSIGESSGGRLGGELDGLDTPTLLGAWATGPWLHDGSADTLEASIAAHDYADFSEADLTALADFVRGL